MKKIIYTALVLSIVMMLSACGAKTTSVPVEDTKAEKIETTATDTAQDTAKDTAKDTTKDTTTDTKATAGDWNKIDKSVSVEGVDYTINAYRKSKGSEIFNSEDGKVFLLIDMNVKNNNKEEAPLSSVMMFELADADGKKYEISLGGLSCLEEDKIEQADGSVAASSEKRCGLAYEVPENVKGIKLSVKGLLGDGSQTVELY